jgi:hypothetical protein
MISESRDLNETVHSSITLASLCRRQGSPRPRRDVGGLAPEPPTLQSPDYEMELQRRAGCFDEENSDDDQN